MRYIVFAMFFILATPIIGHVTEIAYQDQIGKKYWVTSQIHDFKKGACGEGFEKRYEPKAGQSFQIISIKERIPYNDSSASWDGLNILFDNGDVTCMDARFFRFTNDKTSETNPANNYINKKFWITETHSYNNYYTGTCNDRGDKYKPNKRQSFIVNKYIPAFYPSKNQLEVMFDDNQVVCIDIDFLSITSEDPSIKETAILNRLKSAGIQKGATLWLKYPMFGLAGLTKLYVEDIHVFIDEIKVTFASDRYETFTQAFNLENKITDNVYLKLPIKFTKLSKRAATAIKNKNIYIGMTTDEAIASIGRPSDVNRSGGPWGVHEQWVYDGNVYLYFENGKLRSWQN